VLLKADAARSGSEFLQGRVNALSAQISAAAEAVATGTLPQTAMPDADARVIGAALQPLAPSAPRTKLIIAFGAVLGFLTGLFAIVIAYALDRRIYTTQDLVRVSRLPCLAAVTEAPRRERLARAAVSPSERSASSYSQDGFALSLRDLKTALGIELKRHSPGANPVIAFVSWRSGAGCTLLCRKLAEIMQETGSDIFLIDADLRAPGPAVAKEYESEHSLAYALRADVQPAGIMFARRGGVSLLPARSPEQTTNYLADLSSSKMTELISYIRARGPVLLDLPPLQRTADAQAGALQADLVVIVARAGSTTADDVLSAAASLRHVGAHVVGTVLTGARPQGR
jgi:Mrp family chromosome partitioning ATPase